jgi:hypothetical protein
MFSRLFKPRWQHQNPDIRLQGVSELSPLDADQLRHLEQLARGDASAAVRAAASARLTDLSLLDHLINHDADTDVRNAAAGQVMALLAGQAEGAPDAANRLRLVSLTDNPDVLAHVAMHSTDSACQLAALARLDNDDTRMALALSAAHLEVRQAAAQGMACMTRLRQLTREGRDKAVTQAARERLRQLQTEEQEARETRDAIERLQQAAAQLASQRDDPLLKARTEQLQRQRDGLAAYMDDDTRTQVDESLARCHDTVQAAAEQQAREQAQAQAQDELQAALDTLTSLAQENQDSWYGNGTLRAALSTQRLRWETAAEQVSPSPALAQAFAAQVQDWEQRLNTEPTAPAPEAEPEPQAPAEHHPDTGKWLRQLDGALSGRNLKRANRLWHLLHQHNPSPDKALNGRLAARQTRLEELRDWHRFAAEPKKQALCEQMEKLAETPLAPEEQASAIGALQQQWKALMSADPDQDENFWQRFSDAGDRAWAPCASHFAGQQREREQRLAERLALCDTLAGYIDSLDDDNADWAAVQAVRQQAPRDWQALQPAAHDKGRSRKRFSALLSALDERLDAVSERNSAQRQQLLDAARAACDSEDTGAAARTLKQLQQQWRQAPWVQPGVYRRMNKAFRQCCDQFFQAQQAHRQEQKAARAEAESRQQDLLRQLDTLLQAPLADAAGEQLEQLLAQLDEDASFGTAAVSRARQQVARYRRQVRQWTDWNSLVEALAQLHDGEPDEQTLDLAVALEVCSQRPSPADQDSRRLRWQVEKLPGAMTGGGLPDTGKRLDMIREWLNSEPAVDATTRQRIGQCLHALEPTP